MTKHLVTTDWLAQHLNDPHLRVVDIRGKVLPASAPLPHYHAHRADYDTAHIPNAVFIDWTSDIVQPESRSLDIALPDAFAGVMGHLGIGDETHVIAYDDADGMFAARLWWALRYYGHTAVSVLDGGWKKWTAEGRAVTTQLPAITPAVFTSRPQQSLRRTADDVATMSQQGVLIDVRTLQEFRGETSRASRAGHIPEAINLPRQELVQSDGTMLPVSDLQTRFAQAGIQPDSPEVVAYCNSGVSASYALLALTVAGVANGSVYDGSWKDWVNDDTRPIAIE